jgi:rhamnose transport system ATP-binding protein
LGSSKTPPKWIGRLRKYWTLGARFKATQRAAHLLVAEQQQVEIARALFYKSRILVMDEPTAALSKV